MGQSVWRRPRKKAIRKPNTQQQQQQKWEMTANNVIRQLEGGKKGQNRPKKRNENETKRKTISMTRSKVGNKKLTGSIGARTFAALESRQQKVHRQHRHTHAHIDTPSSLGY